MFRFSFYLNEKNEIDLINHQKDRKRKREGSTEGFMRMTDFLTEKT